MKLARIAVIALFAAAIGGADAATTTNLGTGQDDHGNTISTGTDANCDVERAGDHRLVDAQVSVYGDPAFCTVPFGCWVNGPGNGTQDSNANWIVRDEYSD